MTMLKASIAAALALSASLASAQAMSSTVEERLQKLEAEQTALKQQLMDVNKSPASSTFGYYTAGQDGWTVTSSFSVFF